MIEPLPTDEILEQYPDYKDLFNKQEGFSYGKIFQQLNDFFDTVHYETTAPVCIVDIFHRIPHTLQIVLNSVTL